MNKPVLFALFISQLLKSNVPIPNLYLKQPKRERPFKIRVLLDEKNSNQQNIFKINSDHGLFIINPKTNQKLFFKEQELQIITKNNKIYLPLHNKKTNCIKIKTIKPNEIKLVPYKGNLSLDKKPYKGSMRFKIDEKKTTLLVINTLNLDDYIYSVLISESYQTWPLDMQKIQAVVSRSYAISCITQANKNKSKSYDLKRSNFHQTYNGHHNYTHLQQAIKETKNLILTHKNKVVLAMFDACCGGIVPANMKSINFKHAPYLARKRTCNYCKGYKLYKWHREFGIESFVKSLKNNPKIAKKLHNAGKLKDIHITKKDKAAIVHKLKVNFSHKSFSISGIDLWESMRNKVKSVNFKIKKIKNKIIIDGKGFGHQIGLCQRGAREMVRKGYNFKSILQFYYPKTKFSKLKHA